jgi:hypothetical protein
VHRLQLSNLNAPPITHTPPTLRTENECVAYDLTVGYVGDDANGAECSDQIVLKPVTKVCVCERKGRVGAVSYVILWENMFC